MNSKDTFALFKLSKFCKEILATFKVTHSNIIIINIFIFKV